MSLAFPSGKRDAAAHSMSGISLRWVIVGALGTALGLGLRSVIPTDAAPSPTSPQSTTAPETAPALPPAVTPPAPSLETLLAAKGPAFRLGLVRYLRAADLSAVKALLLTDSPELADYFQQRLIYLRAVELDAAEFVRWLGAQDGEAPWVNLRLALELWARTDGPAALASCPDQGTRKAVLREIGKTDPAFARERLMGENPDEWELRELERQEIKQMTEAELASALTDTLASAGGRQRRERLNNLIATWAKKDAVAAWAWLQRQEDTPERHRLSVALALSMSGTDPAAARARLAQLPPNADSLKTEGQIIATQTTRDPEGTIAALASEPNSARRAYLFSQIAGALSRTDPERFFRLLREQNLSATSENVGNWSMTSPDQKWGVSWNSSLIEFANPAALALAEENPARALAEIALLGGEYEPIAAQWARTAPREAAEWLASVPGESEFAISSLFKVLSTWAGTDPQAAVAFVTERNLEPSYARQVGEAWAEKEPAAALGWMQAAHGDLDDTMRSASNQWVLREPEAASAWISEMAPGNRRDHAVAGMIEALVSPSNPHRDDATAAAWTATLQNPALRAEWQAKLNSQRKP